MLRTLVLPALLLLGSSPLSGQTETALKEYFEGRTVSPKLAMPGTENGVDVYPGSPRPLDYSRYANRLKELKEELDELKSAREREDARNRSAVAEAQEHRKQNIRQRRLEGV